LLPSLRKTGTFIIFPSPPSSKTKNLTVNIYLPFTYQLFAEVLFLCPLIFSSQIYETTLLTHFLGGSAPSSTSALVCTSVLSPPSVLISVSNSVAVSCPVALSFFSVSLVGGLRRTLRKSLHTRTEMERGHRRRDLHHTEAENKHAPLILRIIALVIQVISKRDVFIATDNILFITAEQTNMSIKQ